MGSFWKIQTLSFDLPAGENYDDYNLSMDPSPPETENWTPTERKRKRNPLLFLPEDDNSIKFFEKGLHQTVDRPETERDLTPYGSLKFTWLQHPPKLNSKIEFISDSLWPKGIIQIGRKGYISYVDRGTFYTGVEQNKSKGIIFIKSKADTFTVPLINWEKYIREVPNKLSWQIQAPKGYHHEKEYSSEDGDQHYYYDEKGDLHNTEGPAVVIESDDPDNRMKLWYIHGATIGSDFLGFTQEDFDVYKEKNNIVASQKLSWGHERNIWVTHWAVPGNQEMNPTSVQQDWMVVTFLPPDVEGDYMNSFKVIKERFKEYVRQNFPETSSEGSDYMWANAYLWNVQSEKSDFLDKYLTTEEINNMKEDTIVVINKKDFPVEVSNPIERI